MKELKNKDVILGLVVLIILCVIALVLIIRREFPDGLKYGKSDTFSAEGAEFKELHEADEYSDILQSEETKKEDITTSIEAQKEDSELSLETGKQSSVSIEEKEGQTTDKDVFVEKDKVESLALANSKQVKEYATPPEYKEYTGEEMWQLEELYAYWKEYHLEAVDDLIHLPRVRTITNELSDTNRFYYYGETNSSGQPHGSGLAVYADNAYYCGEWKNGKRHGNGMWLQIFPDKAGILNNVPGVIEHSYNGQWQNDYPNGEGQEHISYNEEEMDGEYKIANVIGGFKDGYYNDSLYIMTYDKAGSVSDWEATAKKGTFEYFHQRYNYSGKFPVWKDMNETKEEVFYWLDESKNVNWGIFGLKKMN